MVLNWVKACVSMVEVGREVSYFANSTIDDVKMMVLGSEEWKTFLVEYFVSFMCFC